MGYTGNLNMSTEVQKVREHASNACWKIHSRLDISFTFIGEDLILIKLFKLLKHIVKFSTLGSFPATLDWRRIWIMEQIGHCW